MSKRVVENIDRSFVLVEPDRFSSATKHNDLYHLQVIRKIDGTWETTFQQCYESIPELIRGMRKVAPIRRWRFFG